MIKVITFDLGGVVFAEGKTVAMTRLKEKYGYDSERISTVLKSSQSMKLRSGLLSDEEFWSWAKIQLPEGYDVKLIKQEWYDGYEVNHEILTLLEKLKGKYTLLVFSGNIKSRVDYLDEKYGFRKYFDKGIYSFDYHLNKPAKEFVEAMIQAAGVSPQEIVYIDDNDSDARIAESFGVNVVIYQRGEIVGLLQKLNSFGIGV